MFGVGLTGPEPSPPDVFLYQTWKNFAAQVVLQRDVPILADLIRRRLVALHTDFFVEHSERDGEARRDRLRALFDRTLEAYTEALSEGYAEAQAREITHIMAAWDFTNHGWGELLEIPPEEREAYHERYRPFFDAHGATPERPLGEFAPDGGLPEAPETPERLNGEYPFAEGGLADDVYVHAERDAVRLSDEPAGQGTSQPAAAATDEA
ncbi:MAG: DUF6149 family protein [Halolamina sp.]